MGLGELLIRRDASQLGQSEQRQDELMPASTKRIDRSDRAIEPKVEKAYASRSSPRRVVHLKTVPTSPTSFAAVEFGMDSALSCA